MIREFWRALVEMPWGPSIRKIRLEFAIQPFYWSFNAGISLRWRRVYTRLGPIYMGVYW